MAKLRLQSEWKMWAAVGAIIILVIFYLYMASRPPMEGSEYLWNVTKIVDEKDLTLKGSGNEIELKLAGLKVPPGQTQATRDFLTKTLENQWVRIKIIREGPKGVKEGFVFLSGEDTSARMIRQGLAEIDREEKAFDIRPYIELEQEAKREQRGLWQQQSPGAK
ncbi:MAG: thermonuclease family protein [Desulfomonilaceae bacterium]